MTRGKHAARSQRKLIDASLAAAVAAKGEADRVADENKRLKTQQMVVDALRQRVRDLEAFVATSTSTELEKCRAELAEAREEANTVAAECGWITRCLIEANPGITIPIAAINATYLPGHWRPTFRLASGLTDEARSGEQVALNRSTRRLELFQSKGIAAIPLDRRSFDHAHLKAAGR